jgi:hypothetical protein
MGSVLYGGSKVRLDLSLFVHSISRVLENQSDKLDPKSGVTFSHSSEPLYEIRTKTLEKRYLRIER